jgi:hypothetical protein
VNVLVRVGVVVDRLGRTLSELSEMIKMFYLHLNKDIGYMDVHMCKTDQTVHLNSVFLSVHYTLSF